MHIHIYIYTLYTFILYLYTYIVYMYIYAYICMLLPTFLNKSNTQSLVCVYMYLYEHRGSYLRKAGMRMLGKTNLLCIQPCIVSLVMTVHIFNKKGNQNVKGNTILLVKRSLMLEVWMDFHCTLYLKNLSFIAILKGTRICYSSGCLGEIVSISRAQCLFLAFWDLKNNSGLAMQSQLQDKCFSTSYCCFQSLLQGRNSRSANH